MWVTKHSVLACWLQPEWRVQCESGCSPRFLPELPTVHHGSGSPFPKVPYRKHLGNPVCRWPGNHHWITGGTARETHPLEDQHWRKGTSDQHEQNKVLISGPGLHVLQKPSKDPCAMCLKGIGTNFIFCYGCSSWVHKRCSGIPVPLKPNPSFSGKRCT